MSDKSEVVRRFGTLALAGIFLVTSLAFTGIIFWQESNKDSQPNSNEQEAIRQALEQSSNNEGEEAMSLGKIEDFTPFDTEVVELQKIDIVTGEGEEVKPGASVTVHYTGAYVANGEVFDSSVSRGETITFSLDEVIAGWTQGVPGMKVGGKRRLIIPGGLAYGEAPEGYKPGDGGRPLGPLVFDIELKKVQNQ